MNNKTIKKYLDILDDRSKDILILRFGLDGNEPQTLEKVGEKYQVTRERIRQLQVLALSMIDKEREKIRLTDEELKLIQNALDFFDGAGYVDRHSHRKIFLSILDKLKEYKKKKDN